MQKHLMQNSKADFLPSQTCASLLLLWQRRHGAEVVTVTAEEILL